MPPEEEGEGQTSPVMSWVNSNNNGESTSGAAVVTLEDHQRTPLHSTHRPPLRRPNADDDVAAPQCPDAQPLEEREQSAEEVMEASLSFRQQGGSSHSLWQASSSELYPNPFIETDVVVEHVAFPERARTYDNSQGSDQLYATTAVVEVEQHFTARQVHAHVAAGAVHPCVASTAAKVEEASPVVAFASLNSDHSYAAAAAHDGAVTLDDEAELIAYKRRAAGGGYSHGPMWSTISENGATISALSEQEAVVVDITEHDVHPSDLSQNDARAELIGEDYSRSMMGLPSTPAAGFASDNYLSHSYESYLTDYHATPGDAVVLDDTSFLSDYPTTPGHAVVLGGRSLVNSDETRPPWSSPYSVGTYGFDDGTASLLERKLPATDRRQHHGTPDTWTRNLHHDNGMVVAEEEGEVVGITEDIHPSEMRGASVAEFIGPSSFSTNYPATPGRPVVLDSRSLVNPEAQVTWRSPHSEHYGIDSGSSDLLERKLPAMDRNRGTSDPWAGSIKQDSGVVVAEEGEVVGITEDIHPSEMRGASVAELIGSSALSTEYPATPGHAVVLDSGSLVDEDEVAWSSPYSEHYSVSNGSSDLLERKLPAMDHRNHHHGTPDPWTGNLQQQDAGMVVAEQEGEVVGITEDIHPSEIRGASVAEFIGSSASSTDYQAMPGPTVVIDNRALVDEDEAVTWSSHCPERHGADNGSSDLLERKLPAMDGHHHGTPDPWAGNLQQDAGIVVAEQEGEVVGITEDIHPSEIRGESVAEFIGSSFNVTMAVQSETFEHHSSDGQAVSTEQATVVGMAASDVAGVVIEEDEHAISSYTIETDYSSAVAVPMVSGGSSGSEGERISEAHVLTTHSVTAEDYHPIKSPPTTGNAVMESVGQSGGRHRQSSITFSDPPEVLVPTPRQDGFVIVSSGDFDAVSCGTATARAAEDNVEGTPLPQPSNFHSQREVSTTSTADGSNISRARSDGSGSRSSLQMLSSNIARSTNTVIEKLFGDTPPGFRRHDFEVGDNGGNISPRTLLPWSVFRNEANGMWVVTLNTNQKALDSNNVVEASKALKAFSVPTEKQALTLARSWAPPRMLPFHDNPSCFTCETKFAVFRRACHCRNCGVCICSRCAVQWPSKMIPETYNIKKESIVNICKACDWLCTGFRLALLEGDFDHAVAMHATGNVNLVTPFANVKGELFYPVHCAVLGGNLQLLKWLVDENCCPLRSIRISGKHRDPSNSFTPILTSRGRSLLSIAMASKFIPIIRYLVVDKGMSISAERNVTVDTIIQTLHLVLQILPDNLHETQSNVSGYPVCGGSNNPDVASTAITQDDIAPLSNSPTFQSNPQPQSPIPPPEVTAQHLEAIYGCAGFEDEEASADDMCIICFSNRIDCVVTPCGHQICCLQCSKNMPRCPVCSVDCSFMRVFKA